LFEDALPFWSSVGFDGVGRGFVEHLTPDGAPADAPFKRMRVQARQIYVFSHAATLGFAPGLAVAADSYGFIVRHGLLADGGFARRLGRNGGVLDPAVDLYDMAFVLFAFGWLSKASADQGPLKLAAEALGAIQSRLGRPDGRGYRATSDDPSAEGLQNPHMHLLEAALQLYEVSGDDLWAEEARRLLALFREELYDPRTRTLAERFNPSWRRVRPAVIEPGHHFEWLWLLDRAERLLGVDFAAERAALFKFAEKHGVDPDTGLVHDGVSERGVLVKPGFRLWGQAELLKARLSRAERGEAVDLAGIALAAQNLLDNHLAQVARGCWRDQLDEKRAWVDDKIPASSLYHLFLAFSELLRLRPLLEAA
jgi:mannose/cellobiose epimerase-like protein (N-acyl-D-glucosamine 2-epimerase family)